jgi:hypothetical protein
LQAGVAPPQRDVLAFVHSAHIPLSEPLVMHAGAMDSEHAFEAPEPYSPLHAVQVPFEQMGFVPEHWAFDTHSTHVLVATSHVGVGALH